MCILEYSIPRYLLLQIGPCYVLSSVNSKCEYQDVYGGGGRKRLPKFKFSAKFPIGLHVILQIQIKKFENNCYRMWKIILTENPSRFNVEPLLK